MAKNLYFFQKLKKIFKWAVSFASEGIISKRGSKCKLPYYNKHFEIKTMDVRSGVKLGNARKIVDFFTPFLLKAAKLEPLDQFKRTSKVAG